MFSIDGGVRDVLAYPIAKPKERIVYVSPRVAAEIAVLRDFGNVHKIRCKTRVAANRQHIETGGPRAF